MRRLFLFLGICIPLVAFGALAWGGSERADARAKQCQAGVALKGKGLVPRGKQRTLRLVVTNRGREALRRVRVRAVLPARTLFPRKTARLRVSRTRRVQAGPMRNIRPGRRASLGLRIRGGRPLAERLGQIKLRVSYNCGGPTRRASTRRLLKVPGAGSKGLTPVSPAAPGEAGEGGEAPVPAAPPADAEEGLVPGARVVALGGDDAGPGTDARPWGSIQRGVDALNPGDTLYVRGGLWDVMQHDGAGVEVTRSGRPDAWITIRNYPGERPKITSDAWSTIKLNERSAYVEIRGFELIGRESAISNFSSHGIGLEDSHHSRIIDNHIHDYPGSGVAGVRADHAWIEGNRVWGNARRSPLQTSGISLWQSVNHTPSDPGYHHVIRNNVVWNNENLVPVPGQSYITDGNCIIIDDGRHTQFGSTFPVYTPWTLIENNVCFDNGGRGVNIYLSDNVDVINNTLIRNTRSTDIPGGEVAVVDSANVRVQNNLMIPREGAESPLNVFNATGVARYNNIFQGFGPDALGEGSRVVPDALLVNPVLDPSAIDPRPRPGSPVLGAGRPDPNVTTDFTGALRGNPPSVGAHE